MYSSKYADFPCLLRWHQPSHPREGTPFSLVLSQFSGFIEYFLSFKFWMWAKHTVIELRTVGTNDVRWKSTANAYSDSTSSSGPQTHLNAARSRHGSSYSRGWLRLPAGVNLSCLETVQGGHRHSIPPNLNPRFALTRARMLAAEESRSTVTKLFN